MDADIDGFGTIYDDTRAFSVLCGYGESKKCTIRHDAVLCDLLSDDNYLGVVWI